MSRRSTNGRRRVDVMAALQTTRRRGHATRIHSTVTETSSSGSHPRPPIVADGHRERDCRRRRSATSNVAGLRSRSPRASTAPMSGRTGGADYGMTATRGRTSVRALSRVRRCGRARSLGTESGAVAMAQHGEPERIPATSPSMRSRARRGSATSTFDGGAGAQVRGRTSTHDELSSVRGSRQRGDVGRRSRRRRPAGARGLPDDDGAALDRRRRLHAPDADLGSLRGRWHRRRRHDVLRLRLLDRA